MRERSQKKKRQQRQLTLLIALLLSLLLHAFFLIGSEVPWSGLFAPEDEVLSRKDVEAVPTVRLRLVAGQATADVPPTAPRAAKPRPAPVAENPVIEDEPIPPAEETPPAETAAESTPIVTEPPPAFPVQVRAVLDTRYNGLPFTINQHWVMEGLRYSIEQQASRFGFRIRISSEGKVDPAGGLLPEQYRLTLNDKLRAACNRDGDTLDYGPLDQRLHAALPETPQDMASLPFHVAVTFTGAPQTSLVCTGQNLYQIRLVAEAEELIRLPAGTLRTLHLTGERYDAKTGQLIRGYEVWLALDYLNYPVKFIGRTGNGDKLEYRVKALELEGKWVLGESSDHDTVLPGEEDIPEWLRQRQESQGLNNP